MRISDTVAVLLDVYRRHGDLEVAWTLGPGHEQFPPFIDVEPRDHDGPTPADGVPDVVTINRDSGALRCSAPLPAVPGALATVLTEFVIGVHAEEGEPTADTTRLR